jgi:enoyl-CoA hydratase/carnithine racemase
MRTDYETLKLEEPQPHVLLLTLNRPSSANALNTQMGQDLAGLFSDLYVDQEDYRCVVMTGAGERVFCAGADLKERDGMTEDDWLRQHAIFEQAVTRMMECPLPFIAAVNGAAFAGGFELALTADFIYASTNARFAFTEVTLGIMPGAGGTQNLPRAVGVRRAKELILTGASIDAVEAANWGIVNRLFEPEHLLPEALATASRIAANAPLSVRQAKKAANVATQLDIKTGYAYELEAYYRLVPTEDRQEGIRAYNERRKPSYTGR